MITAKTNAFVLVFGSNREGQAGVGSGSDDSDCISSPTPIHAAENSVTKNFLQNMSNYLLSCIYIDIQQAILSIAPNFNFDRPTNSFQSSNWKQADFHANCGRISSLLWGK